LGHLVVRFFRELDQIGVRPSVESQNRHSSYSGWGILRGSSRVNGHHAFNSLWLNTFFGVEGVPVGALSAAGDVGFFVSCFID
jgi:hypothetical protein